MPQNNHEPITISVSPVVRALIRKGEPGTPLEVMDVQTVIHVLSLHIGRQRDRIKALEDKIKHQKQHLQMLEARHESGGNP